jgi:hypothetical protein
MRDRGRVRPDLFGRMIVFFFALPVLIVTCGGPSRAQEQVQVQAPTPAPPAASPSHEVLEGSAGNLGNVPTTYSIASVGDFNGDGMGDLLWRDMNGNTSVWFMNGTIVASSAAVGNIPTNWTIQSVNAE